MTEARIDRAAIARVERKIRPYVRRTPVLEARGSDFGLASVPVFLKLEQLQHSGSFKVRGAFANLLTRRIPRAGVVAASGGNHGAAVAYAARARRVPATIFVPAISSPAKQQRIRDYGARLVVGGDRYDDALRASEAWNVRAGALPIHAYDQRETILGQGTLGMEIEEQADDVDTVLVSVGGGGLVAGIAAWFAGRVRVVGVEPELAPKLTRAIRAGRPVDSETNGIAADSLAPKRMGELTFGLVQRYLDRVVTVPDAAIYGAQEALWRGARQVAEPGGAAAFAALLARRYRPRPRERVAVVVSGGNTTAVRFDPPPVTGRRARGDARRSTVPAATRVR